MSHISNACIALKICMCVQGPTGMVRTLKNSPRGGHFMKELMWTFDVD